MSSEDARKVPRRPKIGDRHYTEYHEADVIVYAAHRAWHSPNVPRDGITKAIEAEIRARSRPFRPTEMQAARAEAMIPGGLDSKALRDALADLEEWSPAPTPWYEGEARCPHCQETHELVDELADGETEVDIDCPCGRVFRAEIEYIARCRGVALPRDGEQG